MMKDYSLVLFNITIVQKETVHYLHSKKTGGTLCQTPILMRQNHL